MFSVKKLVNDTISPDIIKGDLDLCSLERFPSDFIFDFSVGGKIILNKLIANSEIILFETKII